MSAKDQLKNSLTEAARAMGRKGGKSRSQRKIEAARNNARKDSARPLTDRPMTGRAWVHNGTEFMKEDKAAKERARKEKF